MVIFIIIAVLVYFFVIRPFLRKRETENFASFLALPAEVQTMIHQEDVFELSELLVELELNKSYDVAKLVLDAIASKGFGFSRRVDKVRNEMRIKAGLGPLKHF
jgi:preprotein translocase subunit YajC